MQRVRHNKLWGFEDWLYDDGKVLIKRISADTRLSVQVHPNDETALTVGGRAKTEMWCVLKDGPIFAGFRPGVTKNDVVRAVADCSIEDLLVRFDAKAGECYFLPGGLVHSIGEGTSVFEVQQSSNTTFRFYDWGRVDAEGHPRELHIEEALEAMDLSLPTPSPCDSVDCAYFGFRKCAAGEMPSSQAHRVVYDPINDVLTELAPNKAAYFDNDVFTVTLPR